MVELQVIVDGDACWPDLKDKRIIHAVGGLQLAALKKGMVSGKPSVCFRFELPGGFVLLVETSLALFLTAADTLKAAHGDPRE
jgi:hypothetical protein